MPLDGLPCRTNTVGRAGSPALCTRSARPEGVVTVRWSLIAGDCTGARDARGASATSRLRPDPSRLHAGRQIARIAHADPLHLRLAGVGVAVQVAGPGRDPVLVRVVVGRE